MGTTALGTSFFIAFTFLSGKTNEDYLWAIKELKHMFCREDIFDPLVVVTDRELALMNALNEVFPWAKNILCEWHVAKAILTYVKKEWVFKTENQEMDKEEALKQEEVKQDGFMARLAGVIGSPTVTTYKSWLEGLERDYRDYGKLLQYLKNTWLDPWSNRFIRAHVDEYLHFGNWATSRIKGGHSILKTYLQTSTGDLKMVLEKINLLLTNQTHSA